METIESFQNKPVNISKLINYSDTNISSVTLIKTKKIMITLFAITDKTPIPQYSSDHPIIINVLENSIILKIKDKKVNISRGTSLYIPASSERSITTKSQSKFTLTKIIKKPG